MGACLDIRTATGKANCALCGKKIEKGQHAIGFTAWNASAQVHSRIRDCDKDLR